MEKDTVNRALPRNIVAEQSVIGSVLLDGSAFRQVVNVLKAEDFVDERYRAAYQACLNLYAAVESINEVTVAQEMKRLGMANTGTLAEAVSVTPTSLDLNSYASVVRQVSLSRQMVVLGLRIADEGYATHTDSNEVMERIASMVRGFRQHNSVIDSLVTPTDAFNSIFDLITRCNQPQNSLKWGFKALDDLTMGVYPGELTVIGARTSVGKTQLMLDISNHMTSTQNRTSLFCSVEMGVDPLMEREIARMLGISVLDLRRHDVQEDQMTLVMEKAALLSEHNQFYMPRGISASDIYAAAEKKKDADGLDIVFVDYLQLLRDCWEDGRENQNVRVGRVCKILKNLANDLHVPVVVASQLNRALEHRGEESRRPTLADLRDSGNIEQDADVVFLLYRTPESPQILEVNMAKNRQLGSAPPIKLVWREDARCYGDLAHETTPHL